MCERVFLENLLGLTDDTLVQNLLATSQTVQVKKGSLLVEAGEIQTRIPMLLKGVFRGFLLDVDGSDITDCFVCRRGDIVMGCNALGEPSQISLEAMTDGEVISVSTAAIISMMDSSRELLWLYNCYLMEALERHWEGKMIMHRYSAMERYQWFLRRYPGLIDLVSNKHIASFLGMTPVTLSRLRRQLRDEKAESNGSSESV